MASASPARVSEQPLVVPANQAALARVHRGAKWFYWIGGLSLLNSGMVVFGRQLHFVVGLGITSVVDGMARQAGSPGVALSIVINGFVAGVFVLFGSFAMKSQKWAFMTGMAVYALDSLLVLGAKDLLSAGFHAYALFSIYKGLAAVEAAGDGY